MKAQPLRLTLREATSTAILDAAERVAAQGGVSGANLQAIADEAGIAVGTIYNYFADKTRLFDALFERRREELYVHVDLALKPRAKDPFEDQLRAFVGAVFTHFDARRDFLRIALEAERPQLVKGQDGKKRPALQQLQDRAERIVRVGLRENLLRQDAGDLLATVLVAILRGILVAHAQRESAFAFAQETDRVVELFLHGASL